MTSRPRITLTTLIALSTIAFCAPESLRAEADRDKLESVAAGDHRSAEHKARDQYRNPVETLSFMGMAPDMTVVEIWPGGGGWYAQIIGPYLRDEGDYTAAIFGPAAAEVNDYYARNDAAFQELVSEHVEAYGDLRTVGFYPPAGGRLAEPGSVDMIVTFRNMHNWMKNGFAEAGLAMFHEALKPGGYVGVVDHRADPSLPLDPKAENGYVDEAYAVKLMQDAGFELVAISDVNDNPADSADHPRGVWTLPPSLRLGEEDREKYEAIGESDRFTHLYRKR